jgi:YD repeat-containing protein
MNMKLLFFFCLLLIYARCHAQYDGSVPAVTPVTPTAATLFKISERPIGSFSGTTPINIPLYTLATGSLQLPVTLNYNNGGIRVEEIASWAGLGWTLDPGGQISRSMRGTPDEDISHNGLITSTTLPKPSTFPGTNYAVNAYYVVSGNLDEEPDIYYFNFLGNSGKFYFDESGNPHMISQQPLNIQKTISGDEITEFIMTDAQGNQYIFGDSYVENSYATYTSQNGYSNVPSGPTYNSTWKLHQIKDLSGEHVINLSYTYSSTSFQTWSGGYMAIGGMTGTDCLASDSYSDEVTVTTSAVTYHLANITCGNDSLVFYTSADPVDEGTKLDSLRLFATGGIPRNGYHLNKSWFNYSGGSFNVYTNRLKLNNLAAFGSSGSDSLFYSFTYNTSVNLPSRISFGTDYWGYYNGNDYNWTNMPNAVYTNGGTILPEYNLGDRRANGTYAAANVLTQITYPTGGYRSFDYQGNTALLEPGTQVKPDAGYYQTQYLSGSGFTYMSSTTPIFTDTFSVNSTDNATDFNFDLSGYGSGSYSVQLFQKIGGVNYSVFTFTSESSGNFVLNNGSYSVEVFENVNCDFTGINCWWSVCTLNSNTTSRYNATLNANNISAGGVRVSAVHDFDPVTGVIHTTSYQYLNPTDTLLSGGLLISPVQVAHQGGCGGGTRNCQYIRLSTSSQYPLSTEGGSFVVYPNVRTLEDSNGHIDREYSFAFDQTPQGYDAMTDFPIGPVGDNSWQRGQLVIEQTYDSNWNLLKRNASMGQGIYSSQWGPPYPPYTSTDYLLSYQLGYRVVGYNQTYSCNDVGLDAVCAACWKQYTLQSMFAGIRSTTTTTYQPGGGSQVKQTDYSYWTNEGYPLLQTKTDYLQNGDTMRTHYCYAVNNTTDFVLGLSSTQAGWLTTLHTANYLQPLEVTITVTPSGATSSTFVEGYKYCFAYYNSSKPHISTIIHYTSQTDSVVTNLSAYDTYGNLTEEYKNYDNREVYLWGYNGQYPVAKVVGNTYATVSEYVTYTALQNPSSDAALRAQINNIRVALPGLQVTTYTYSPGLGLTSQTDPAGMISYYEYDSFGRLLRIRDQNNNILQKFNYNYYNTATP